MAIWWRRRLGHGQGPRVRVSVSEGKKEREERETGSRRPPYAPGQHCSSDEGAAGMRGRELGSLQRGHCGDREEEDAVF